MKKIFLFFFLLFLLSPQKTLAVTFTFDGAPSNITDTQSFSINVTLNIANSTGKIYYIRAAFFHPDSPSSYFGYTKNNIGDWYKVQISPTPTDKTQFYKVIMDEGEQKTFIIEAKPDQESNYYKNKGPGVYNFKLGRYTEGGNSPIWCSGEDMPCSIASISIASSVTPTPTPTPTPTLTPAPTSTPSPIKTPTPKPSTPKPTVSSAPTPTPKATAVSVSLARETSSSKSSLDILGTESAEPSLEPVKKSEEVKTLGTNENNLPKILMGLGVIIILSGAGIYVKSLKK